MVTREVSFESTETMAADEFAEWLAERERWDPLNHFELLNGRIVMTPPAAYPHGSVGFALLLLLGNYVKERGLGRVFDASQGFSLPQGDTVEPDLAFVSVERWNAGPAPEEGKFLRLVPDLVVQVLSPSTASRDRGEKRAIYERAGVREYWLVDPRAREVVVLAMDDHGYGAGRRYGEEAILASRVLEGLAFPVADIFRDL